MRKKQIDIPIYHGDLVLIKYKHTKDLKKYKLGIKYEYDAVTFKHPHKSGLTRYVMAFRNCTPSKIAHEAFHCLRYIYDDRGIELTIDTDEPSAYLLGWIVKQCHNFLSKERN